MGDKSLKLIFAVVALRVYLHWSTMCFLTSSAPPLSIKRGLRVQLKPYYIGGLGEGRGGETKRVLNIKLFKVTNKYIDKNTSHDKW